MNRTLKEDMSIFNFVRSSDIKLVAVVMVVSWFVDLRRLVRLRRFLMIWFNSNDSNFGGDEGLMDGHGVH